VETKSELSEGALLLLVAFLLVNARIAIFSCTCLSSSRRCNQLQQTL